MVALLLAVCTSISDIPMQGQVRGVYPLGMSAVNSGITPEPGFTYTNNFLFYSRDTLRGPQGQVLATGQQSVLMDMNSLIWVNNKKIKLLGGAAYSFSITLPVANNSLTSNAQGPLNGGGGFADSYYQPLILGWREARVDVRAIYGFLAPTGRFSGGASTNVGSGYWTSVAAAGETFFLTENQATAISAFQMYEFHSTQRDTNIHPGETVDLDYSLTQLIPLEKDSPLQLGLVGYAQWQTTDESGPTISPQQARAHYRVNALGFTSNVILRARKVNLGLKYFHEFFNRSTYQGYALQISGTVTF